MCCFTLKRRTPSVEQTLAVDVVPIPSIPVVNTNASTSRPPKVKSSFRVPSFYHPPTPPITPEFTKEQDPFDAIQVQVLSPPPTPEAPLPHLRVLLVDDNPINLDVLSRLLQTHHFSNVATISPRSFTNPIEALEHLEEADYDLILLDIDMPELSGVETALAIRANHNGAIRDANIRAPIVAVTTNNGPEARLRYKQAGMLACLGKPLDVLKLKAVMEEVIETLS